MPRRTDTRRRMLIAAERLFAEKGYLATSLDDVASVSQTPRGSVYFHFPGGKEQIATETAQALSRTMPGVVEDLASECHSSEELVSRFFSHYAQVFEASGFRRGCPVAATVLEMSDSASFRLPLNAVFVDWRRAFADFFERMGAEPSRAAAGAAAVLAAFEGALVQARAAGSSQILHQVGDEVAAYVALRLQPYAPAPASEAP